MSEDHLKWSYLKTYFEQQLSTSDTTEKKSNFTFKCMLCIPKIKLISTSISSNSNLKTHIKVSLFIFYSKIHDKLNIICNGKIYII